MVDFALLDSQKLISRKNISKFCTKEVYGAFYVHTTHSTIIVGLRTILDNVGRSLIPLLRSKEDENAK